MPQNALLLLMTTSSLVTAALMMKKSATRILSLSFNKCFLMQNQSNISY